MEWNVKKMELIYTKIEMKKNKEKQKCILCKKQIEDPYGHNAEPLAKGRCCSDCNSYKVVPERIYRMMKPLWEE